MTTIQLLKKQFFGVHRANIEREISDATFALENTKNNTTAELQQLTGRSTTHRGGLISAARAILRRRLAAALAARERYNSGADDEAEFTAWVHQQQIDEPVVEEFDRKYAKQTEDGASLFGILVQDSAVDQSGSLPFVEQANAWLDPEIDPTDIKVAIPSPHEHGVFRLPSFTASEFREGLKPLEPFVGKPFVMYLITREVMTTLNGDSYKDMLRKLVPRGPLHEKSINGLANFIFSVPAIFYGGIVMAYIRFIDDNFPPQDFRLFSSPSINCVIDCTLSATSGAARERIIPAIQKYLQSTPDYKSFAKARVPECVLKAVYEKEKRRLKEEGVDQQTLVAFGKLMRVRYRVYHAGGLWFDTDPDDVLKFTCVDIYGHNEHASLLNTRFRKIGQPKDVTYVKPEELNEMLLANPQPCEFVPDLKTYTVAKDGKCDIRNLEILSVQYGPCIYKSYKPPCDHKKFYKCTSEISFEVKLWKSGVGRPLRQPYYSIARLADHHIGAQFFTEISRDKFYHGIDVHRAFSSYYKNPLYARFGFPRYPCLFVNEDLSHIEGGGWSLVTKVIYRCRFTEATKWIQPGCWYTHIRLYRIMIRGLATFEISHTVCAQADFTRLPLKPIDDGLRSSKEFNNTFIGMLISGGGVNTIEKYYHSTSINERRQIIHDAKKSPEYISGVDCPLGLQDVVQITNRSRARTQCWHTHSYILDYQQDTIFDAASHIPFHLIVGTNTDAIVFKQEISLDVLPEYLRARFKPEYKQIKFFAAGSHTHMKDHVVTPLREGIDLNSIDTYFHTFAQPSAHEHVRRVQRLERPPHISQHLARLGKITLTNGGPGCGKTYRSMISQRMPSSIILTPTNLLKSDHLDSMITYDEQQGAAAQRLPEIMTVHAFLQLDEKFQPRTEKNEIPPIIAENILIDEITMVPKALLSQVIEKATNLGMRVHLFGDIDKNGIHQRRPVKGEPITYEWLMEYLPTYSTEISQIRRQKLPRDCEFVDSLRGLSYGDQVSRLIESELVNIVSEADVPKLWDEGATGISTIHENIHRLNHTLFALGHAQVPGRYIRTSRKIPKGKLRMVARDAVWTGRKTAKDATPADFDYELAYFTTADACQGGTRKGKLFIDLDRSGSPGALYTAVTRCEYLQNVYLIRGPLTISPARVLRLSRTAPYFYEKRIVAANPSAAVKPIEMLTPPKPTAVVSKPETLGPRIQSMGVYGLTKQKCDFICTNTTRICHSYGHAAYNIDWKDLRECALDALRSMKQDFNLNEYPSKDIITKCRLFLDIDMDVSHTHCVDIEKFLLSVVPAGDHKILRNQDSGKVHIVVNAPICNFSMQVDDRASEWVPKPEYWKQYEDAMKAFREFHVEWNVRENPHTNTGEMICDFADTDDYKLARLRLEMRQAADNLPTDYMNYEAYTYWLDYKSTWDEESGETDPDDMDFTKKPFDINHRERYFDPHVVYVNRPTPDSELAIKMFFGERLRQIVGVDETTWERAYDFKAHGLRAAFSVKTADKHIKSTAYYAPYDLDCFGLTYKQKAMVISDCSIYKPITGTYTSEAQAQITECMAAIERSKTIVAEIKRAPVEFQVADKSELAGVLRVAADVVSAFEFLKVVGCMYMFKRVKPSWCQLCSREHATDNSLMITTHKKDGVVRVYERCRRADSKAVRTLGEFTVDTVVSEEDSEEREEDVDDEVDREINEIYDDDNEDLAEDTTSWRD